MQIALGSGPGVIAASVAARRAHGKGWVLPNWVPGRPRLTLKSCLGEWVRSLAGAGLHNFQSTSQFSGALLLDSGFLALLETARCGAGLLREVLPTPLKALGIWTGSPSPTAWLRCSVPRCSSNRKSGGGTGWGLPTQAPLQQARVETLPGRRDLVLTAQSQQ